jgi:hypothetical protein
MPEIRNPQFPSYPFITPIGRKRTTFLLMPAPDTTSTT